MIKDGRTFILLADGRRARALVEERRGAQLNAPADWELEISEDDLYEPQDRPPRSFDRNGAGRHAMERVDLHEAEEKKFLTRVAARVAQAAARKEFDHLVIAAPPRALGLLRDALPERVRALVALEAPKDLLAEDAARVRERLKDLRQGG